jgi:hypothetical protein
LCKVYITRLKDQKCLEGLDFLTKLATAVAGVTSDESLLKHASLQTERTQLFINKANQLERENVKDDAIKCAEKAIEIVEKIFEDSKAD